MEQEALTKLADEDEEGFTPFLQGLKKELFHFKMDKLTPAMYRIAQQFSYRDKAFSKKETTDFVTE